MAEWQIHYWIDLLLIFTRLPSPFSKSNKSSLSSASVNKVESSNANANSRLKSSNSERLKAQLNQQNNNIQPQNSGKLLVSFAYIYLPVYVSEDHVRNVEYI